MFLAAKGFMNSSRIETLDGDTDSAISIRPLPAFPVPSHSYAAPVPLSVETEIVSREAFDDSLKEDPDTRDALWIIRQNETFPKKVSSVVQQIRVYAVRERRDDGYAGGFVHAAIAMAPFALPITFHGDFQMYRVPDAPRSVLTRLFDLLRGCGRR